jgi:hypothetical protein
MSRRPTTIDQTELHELEQLIEFFKGWYGRSWESRVCARLEWRRLQITEVRLGRWRVEEWFFRRLRELRRSLEAFALEHS